MAAKLEFPTMTIEVIAVTEPPATGFMVGGRRIEKGEKVRVELHLAEHLARVGKAQVLPDSEKTELL